MEYLVLNLLFFPVSVFFQDKIFDVFFIFGIGYIVSNIIFDAVTFMTSNYPFVFEIVNMVFYLAVAESIFVFTNWAFGFLVF